MAHAPTCDTCGEVSKYRDPDHDAYTCEGCDVWVEKQCGDATCEFCASRPERPSEVKKSGK